MGAGMFTGHAEACTTNGVHTNNEDDMAIKAKRRLRDVDVEYISLVDKGANGKTIIWKRSPAPAAGSVKVTRTVPILKTDEEKRLVYGIVYSPDEVDSEGDTMTAADIEKMAYNFMAQKRTQQVDKQHDGEADEGFVAESWILKDGDPLFPDENTGAWAVGIKVVDDETWEQVKTGEIGGLSMGGFAKAELLEKREHREDGIFKSFFKKMFGAGQTILDKDFAASFNKQVFREAIWGLNDALLSALEDKGIEDKRAALVANAEQFINFITNLEEVPAMQTKEDTEITAAGSDNKDVQKQSGDNAPLAGAHEDKTVVEKLDKIIAAVEEIPALKERIEKLEKAHPGRQSVEDQDPDKSTVAKKYKGFQFV
ncbi:MAG TPA: hypothetical protein ENK06_07440 [Gammaproteobacteria bacterium]|nr:hypothetical protein [Gammaproteobacteria bacterium]